MINRLIYPSSVVKVMDILSAEIWQMILNFNDSPSDIRIIELVCRAFRDLSRLRPTLTFYIADWSNISRYTKLIVANGLIRNCCEDIFKSKLQTFSVMPDMINRFEFSEVAYYCLESDDTDLTLIKWLTLYPKQSVKVYSNALNNEEFHDFDRRLLYTWTSDQLIVHWVNCLTQPLVESYRLLKKGSTIVYCDFNNFDYNDERLVIVCDELRLANVPLHHSLDDFWRSLKKSGTGLITVTSSDKNGWYKYWHSVWDDELPQMQLQLTTDEHPDDEFYPLTEKEMKFFDD